MKKLLVLLFSISLLFPIMAQTGIGPDTNRDILPDLSPAPYIEEEFPQWSKDLRRAEIIFFGSTPFTFLFTAVGYRTGKYGYNSLTAEPGSSIPGWNELEQDDQKNMIIISLGLSFTIAVIDYFLGRVQRSRDDQS